MPYQESEIIELKSILVYDIKKEIIAFANSDGDTLYIDVRDDDEVVGVDDPDGTALQVSNMVRDSTKPDVTKCTGECRKRHCQRKSPGYNRRRGQLCSCSCPPSFYLFQITSASTAR